MGLYNFPTSTYANCSSCGCGSDVCTPDKVDNSCSLSSIRKTLLEIINAIKNENLLGFNVDVEITTNDGILNIINFSKININSIEVNKTTLITPNVAISLCDIAKITIVTSETENSSFNAKLLTSIRNITSSCMEPNSYYSGVSLTSNYSPSNVQCAQGMQNYINENIGLIDSISYNGNASKIETISVLDNVQKTNVVGNSILNTTNKEVLSSATLTTSNAQVVNNITPSNEPLVSNVELETKTILTNTTPTTTEVSAPITTTPTTVVTDIKTEDSNIVNNVNTTTKNVIETINTTTANAISSFSGSGTLTGVVSGLDNVKSITPTVINIPQFTETRNGNLQVTIKKESIDGIHPRNDMVLNVTVDDTPFAFTGNQRKFVLNDTSNVLGGNNKDPIVASVPLLGTPRTESFIKTITPTNINVVDTVTPTITTGKLLTDMTANQINNIETPTTKTVVENLTGSSENINVVSNVSTTTPSELFTTTNTNVIKSSVLNTNKIDVVGNASIANTVTPVVSDLSTKTQNVYLPVKENLEGNIFAAGDGIMGVNNTNGDITVYSICDINSVEKQTPTRNSINK